MTAPASQGAEGIWAPLGPIEAYLTRWSASLTLPPHLSDAIRYSFLAGGKRLRPVLAWHCAGAVGGRGASSLPAGLAVELVHCFSLVHDDLPAMDDDDLRRGKPTLHVHAGEAMAILAGDAMLALAFGALTEQVHDRSLVPPLVRELALGTSGMIAGQVYDTLGGLPKDMAPGLQVQLIHVNKTGALLRASCRMGAMLGLADAGKAPDDPALHAIDQYADAVGLMFQIVDDLIDVEQSAEHTGKRTKKDLDAGKMTYPGVMGVGKSRLEADLCRDKAVAAAKQLGAPGLPLVELAEFLATRTK